MSTVNKEFASCKEIHSLDLTAAKERARKLHKFSEASAALVSELYKKFLFIQGMQKSFYLLPTPLIDTFWMAHIADFSQYISDTKDVFGEPLSHYTSNPAYVSKPDQHASHRERFVSQFKHYFGEDIKDIEHSISMTPKVSNEEVEKYVADMQQKFEHTKKPLPGLSNIHNRIKPY